MNSERKQDIIILSFVSGCTVEEFFGPHLRQILSEPQVYKMMNVESVTVSVRFKRFGGFVYGHDNLKSIIS